MTPPPSNLLRPVHLLTSSVGLITHAKSPCGSVYPACSKRRPLSSPTPAPGAENPRLHCPHVVWPLGFIKSARCIKQFARLLRFRLRLQLLPAQFLYPTLRRFIHHKLHHKWSRPAFWKIQAEKKPKGWLKSRAPCELVLVIAIVEFLSLDIARWAWHGEGVE